MEGIARFWAKIQGVKQYASIWQSGNVQRCTLSMVYILIGGGGVQALVLNPTRCRNIGVSE